MLIVLSEKTRGLYTHLEGTYNNKPFILNCTLRNQGDRYTIEGDYSPKEMQAIIGQYLRDEISFN